ncbi:hypothetical protein [Bacillus sp. AK031]
MNIKKRKRPDRAPVAEKETKLLANKTSVYYTVKVSEDYLVSYYDYPMDQVVVSSAHENPYCFHNLDYAKNAAEIVKGKIIKHTSHTIETEELEEVIIDEQE